MFLYYRRLQFGYLKKYNSKKVSDLAKKGNMHQIITDSTRITDKSRTVIDLIFISRLELVTSSIV